MSPYVRIAAAGVITNAGLGVMGVGVMGVGGHLMIHEELIGGLVVALGLILIWWVVSIIAEVLDADSPKDASDEVDR